MINLYMDDYRKHPPGFTLARSTEECLLLLRECEVCVLSLDYDMGPEDFSGGEVARRIVLEGLFPHEIYLHTSSLQGRREMYEILYPAVPGEVLLHNGPLDPARLLELAGGACSR
ncbi:cyclic-phosphate processing receiver domain-containing protein [Paenibacillus sp. S150]|uniref:cyclic-phosphate processing receiver domain-containing protein n=1 Tax=Paenibacillus sp. S150 TaxID=2749826 RepID=UPI001C585965|nr:cyclic-phosphate processing receiver domain-containing protein [Paenibacillus sp. S150]MBW4080432.1 cell division protein FtsJ [Paenibacillus sp. S150]